MPRDLCPLLMNYHFRHYSKKKIEEKQEKQNKLKKRISSFFNSLRGKKKENVSEVQQNNDQGTKLISATHSENINEQVDEAKAPNNSQSK